MSDRTVIHDTFVIERTFAAPPAKVFRAFADKDAKSRWFGGPDDWTEKRFELDFRVGGTEISEGAEPNGPSHRMEGRYFDIVENERFVFVYDLFVDDAKLSVSMMTVELEPAGSGTHMVFTEHDAFLDGLEPVGLREEGTRGLIEALAASLEREPAAR
jgi:uncharacterized protein YndB with AHSA1/START domain